MNKLLHALAVIEDRLDDHAVSTRASGAFGVIRVVCKCGWEGPEHRTITPGPWLTSDLMADAEKHAGPNPKIWDRNGLAA